MAIMITIAPLVLGLAAWTFGGICLAPNADRKQLGAVSWMLCACALWFPLYTIHRWIEDGDMSAVMDCTYAYCLCAGVLIAGTLLLQLAAAVIYRKK